MSTKFIVVQVDDVKKWNILSSEKDQFDDVKKQDDSREDEYDEDEYYEDEYDPVPILYENFNVIAIGTMVLNWDLYDKIQDVLESELPEKPLKEGKCINMPSCVVFSVTKDRYYSNMITDLTWDETEPELYSWVSNDKTIEVWYK